MNSMIPIPGHPGYYASDDGHIFSEKMGDLKRLKGRRRTRGHLGVVLFTDGKKYDYTIHRLVMFTFIGPPPEGMECRHLNGIPHDNRLCNLKWGTSSENALDKNLHGTMPHLRGETNPFSKLTETQAREIKTSDDHVTVLAKKFGVCRMAAWNVRHGVTWRHV